MSVTGGPPGREEPFVLVIAKAPVPGRSKTRLAASIGVAPAATLARAMLLDTFEGCRLAFSDVGIVCSEGDDVPLLTELVGPDAPVILQQGIGLSGALTTGVRYGLARRGTALLVSSDIPGVPPGSLEAAATLLDDGIDVVLGPGHDGGYWLLGLRGEHPELFAGIVWSTGSVLETTLARCAVLGLEARLLEPWRDIDTDEDISALREVLDRLPGIRTRTVLANLQSVASTPLKQEVSAQ